MLFNKLVEKPVGTDVSRPLGNCHGQEDVIHRSYRAGVPIELALSETNLCTILCTSYLAIFN